MQWFKNKSHLLYSFIPLSPTSKSHGAKLDDELEELDNAEAEPEAHGPTGVGEEGDEAELHKVGGRHRHRGGEDDLHDRLVVIPLGQQSGGKEDKPSYQARESSLVPLRLLTVNFLQKT